jgi:large subunit ribosomal protein L22
MKTATHKYARTAPRKARLVMDMIRGRKVDDAMSVLQFSKRRAAVMIAKVIKSAVANYNEQTVEQNNGELIISEARVDAGPVIKRFQPKDRGKAHNIMKRTSHLVITVKGEDEAVEDAEVETQKA